MLPSSSSTDPESGYCIPDPLAGYLPEPVSESKLRKEAKSFNHLLTHLPYNKYCPACVQGKMTGAQHRRVHANVKTKYKKFGYTITCDHVDSRNGPGMNGHLYLLDILDIATKFIGFYPDKTKTPEGTFVCVAHFIGNDKAKVLYADRASEFDIVAKRVGVTYVGSTPGVSGSNGKIERSNRYIEDMTRSVLIAAGLPPFSGSLRLSTRP